MSSKQRPGRENESGRVRGRYGLQAPRAGNACEGRGTDLRSYHEFRRRSTRLSTLFHPCACVRSAKTLGFAHPARAIWAPSAPGREYDSQRVMNVRAVRLSPGGEGNRFAVISRVPTPVDAPEHSVPPMCVRKERKDPQIRPSRAHRSFVYT